ncbi:hypothetical protein FHR84_001130 [Actinopolyspora biskrensis]|uniref:Uncharacterized protein n=1 Tax=Actinopolyspora biskrensis TaxID=1470178 RepID=A0A852Z2G1_9ACTN|nr:hypothetical protein [Actinopolyspora biskrensis]
MYHSAKTAEQQHPEKELRETRISTPPPSEHPRTELDPEDSENDTVITLGYN